jgi:hypothetical protein
MALSSPRKKQAAVASAAVGVPVLGAVAAGTQWAAAASSPPAAAITVTAKTDTTGPTDDTVFTISGVVRGAQPGAKVRLQSRQTPTATNTTPAWSTLPYTTFTDKDDKFSLAVKMETSGSYDLRVLHPQDKAGPATAFSDPILVNVSAASDSTKQS